MHFLRAFTIHSMDAPNARACGIFSIYLKEGVEKKQEDSVTNGVRDLKTKNFDSFAGSDHAKLLNFTTIIASSVHAPRIDMILDKGEPL